MLVVILYVVIKTTLSGIGGLILSRYIREPINSLTHLAGAILAFVGLLALVIKASLSTGEAVAISAVVVFGISMILLYSASATYHMIIARDKIIAFFRRIDHSMIFILIAGSYTPFCLISLGGKIGWTLFTIVSVLALAGILFKMIWFTCPRWISTCLYIGLGWIIIIAIKPLGAVIGLGGTSLLIAGGILYTIGGVIYGLKPSWLKNKYFGFHEIFHIFILLGSLAHYFSVYFFVL